MSESNKAHAAAERARWLLELARAIDEAQQVAWQLGAGSGRNAEAVELYARLEAARSEVEALSGRLVSGRLEPPEHGDDPSAAWDVRRKPPPDDQTPSGKSPPRDNGSR